MNPEHGYAPVRRNTDGQEWLDMAAFSGALDMAQMQVRTVDTRIPTWAAANPVVRYADVVVLEKADYEARELQRFGLAKGPMLK